MRLIGGLIGGALLAVVLWDAFETIILPRRVSRRFRLTRAFYRTTWMLWRASADRLPRRSREAFLGFYGPMSLLMLLGLWAFVIVFAFGTLQWAVGQTSGPAGTALGAATDLYLSGTTFFTLGLGDVVPRTALAKIFVVLEAGTGFAFLAIVVGYFPVIYQAFSRREVVISLLDARAGSPPTAGELLWRHRAEPEELQELLRDWERWAADLLESHISYPAIAYFRSQHSNQSWIAALTTILDTCALVMAGPEGTGHRQARLTFAMTRHAVVDLAQVFGTPPSQPATDRLTPEDFARLQARLAQGGMVLREGPESEEQLTMLRRAYEPYLWGLGYYLRLPLPPWIPGAGRPDNWQASPWGMPNLLANAGPARREAADHF